nr:UDP-glucuronosyltransferase 2B31-like [Leptinotarsa decemlineata]
MIRYPILTFIIYSLCYVRKTFCANILLTEDLGSPSHQIWNYALADELVLRGHNVTILGPKSIPLEGHEKFHRIELEGLYSAHAFDSETLYSYGRLNNLQLINEYALFTCNHSLGTNGFRTLMNYPKDFKFDVILFDITVSNCLLPLSQRFKSPPSIGLTALLLPPHLSEAFGNPYQSSYLPHILFQFSNDMSFLERLQNYVWTKLEAIVKKYYYTPKSEEIARRVFGKSMQPFDTLLKQLSLLLCNLSPGFHHSQPFTPNIIPVGGVHIDTKKKLPQDLQEIMDNAKHGVILFSLGSNVRSDALKVEKRKAIIDAFSKLNQIILWKFESQLSDVPKNVIIRRWLPQSEILAHPNLKLFITHGGGLSTIEGAFFGVPMLGIPFFVDQYHNIDLVLNRKMGSKLEYSTLTSDTLLSSIQAILNNPMYSEEAKKISRVMRDMPETAMERAIFWIEYVMRHNGTHILDPKSRSLSNFVSSSTDIHLFLLLLFVLLLYTSFKVVSSIISMLLKKKHKKTKKE